MPRYDFQCQHCNNVVEVTCTIENRNNPIDRCDRVLASGGGWHRLGQDAMLCGGTYMRVWTPRELRVDTVNEYRE